MWFGTIDGLNRYDGYTFEVFRPSLGDSTSISNNRVSSIVEDSYGNLWIGTENGLNIYSKGKNSFTRINFHDQKSNSKVTREVINDLLFDEQTNVIWIATKNGTSKANLDSIKDGDFSKLKFVNFNNGSAGGDKYGSNETTTLAMDKTNKLLAVTRNAQLQKYDPKTDRFNIIPTEVKESREFDYVPMALFVDNDGNIWMGNDLSSLLIIDNEKPRTLSITDQNIPIYDLYQDDQGLIWVSTGGFGLYILNSSGKLIQNIVHDASNPYSLPINQTSKLIRGRNGLFWIATFNRGVAKLDLKKSSFGHYFYQSDKKNGMSTKIAQSVLEDNQSRIWIGTDGGGLNLFNETENSYTNYTHDPANRNSLSTDKILCLEESHDGSIWVCTWDGGLNRFYPDSGTAIRFLHDPQNPASIGQNTVWCAKEDSRKRLWIGTQSAGLNMLDTETGRFSKYVSDPDRSESLMSDFVFSMYLDSRERLLIGTSLGLCWLDLNSLDVQGMQDPIFERITASNILGTRVNYITEDFLGNIWVGSDLGLHKLDENLKYVKSYSMIDGLPNNLITGIQEDKNNDLWITSKNGISRLDADRNTFNNFNVNDGVQGLEFQSKSIAKTSDGRILAGGINGFNLFNPDDIILETKSVVPKLTNLKVFNRTIEMGDKLDERTLYEKPLESIEKIVLDHGEGYLAFEFGALHFQNPQRVVYAYRMDGIDPDYVFAGTVRTVNYTGLQPGDYLFEVMASLDGRWDNAQKLKLAIEVLSPPWKSWWAYSLYVVFIFLLVWLIISFFARRIKDAREHELDQMKLKFFINVSHEFRTPLTLISNPVNKIISSYDNPQLVRSSAEIIQRSATKLLKLVNQLLDFRKMDLGKAPLDPVKGDIVKFIQDVSLFFENAASVKSIDLNFHAKDESLFVWFDPDKLEKIMNNLISNAMKFTQTDGTVSVGVRKVSKKEIARGLLTSLKTREFVEITVLDSGIGLKKSDRTAIFERFHHIDNTNTGIGIGLNFSKSLIEQHGGTIEVESEYGKGTKFTVLLPTESKQLREVLKSNKGVRHTIADFDVDEIKSLEYELTISDSTSAVEFENDQVNQSILIVDDNKELRVHLQNELSDHFKIKLAANGKEGLEKALKFYPDIIISDVMMPEMDGFEMCRLIKTNPEVSHIPIVLLTARSLEEDRFEGYSTGADGYIPKPFSMDVLKARLKNLLEAKQRLKEKFTSHAGFISSSEVTTNSFDEKFLDDATKLILESVSDSEFGLEQLLRGLAISRSQFYRKINSLTGQNPSNFIRTVRLKYAADLLVKQQGSIKEIAYMSGFNSAAYFSKTFRELYGKTPVEFSEETLRTRPPKIF